MLPGIGQTQVNTKVDMTFARGLRAILRQDPDVVMVGEIRDLETAEIAVQASLTGHLVLSTLHTNTAIGAVTRLQDMGVEPFLLSSSLIAVMAQRLVRLLCPDCRRAAPLATSRRRRCWAGCAKRRAHDALPPRGLPALQSHRLPRPQRDLRADRGRRPAARPDPRRRRGAGHDRAGPRSVAEHPDGRPPAYPGR
jgi:type II secretory ATPase GspE/PulE/Tfp pilus assembly ATPase PilB-like protein